MTDSDDSDELISNTFDEKKNVESQRDSDTVVVTVVATAENESSEKWKDDEEQQEPKIQTTKKRRREQKKMYCDQDVHADNYSTWVPPSDQAGDGKTSLNEKYGY